VSVGANQKALAIERLSGGISPMAYLRIRRPLFASSSASRPRPSARPLASTFGAAAAACLLLAASASHAAGHVTQLCGHTPPLPFGFTGTSPAPGCEAVCSSTWADGTCTDPPDAGSRVDVYGCPGKTSGAPCDGTQNGGVFLTSFTSGDSVSISSFANNPTYGDYCTFQLDVLRPNGADPIGLRDFLIWERDTCGPPDPPDPPCDCPGGTDYLGNSVHATTCGERVCGADYRYYSCEAGGWSYQGEVCNDPPGCSCEGTNYEGQPVSVNVCGGQVCGGDHQWYACEEYGWVAQGGDCPAENLSWTAVSAGTYHNCGVRGDGSVNCWGANYTGQAPAFIAGPFVQVSAGVDSSCGLLSSGDISCWGNNEYGQAPAFVAGPFTSVAAGTANACAVRVDGSLECWGELPGAVPSGTFVSAAPGGYHNCALRTDGTLACWGQNGQGQATPPSGQFVQVSAAYTSNCAVRADGTLACWGQNTWGETEDQSGPFTQVSTMYMHGCGLRVDGTLACWGDTNYGAGYAVDGTFTQVSAGTRHNCALSTEGVPVCWGDNSAGQLNVPN
jgi:Regulator of Chromosome Condensation (RCC1) repeat protein